VAAVEHCEEGGSADAFNVGRGVGSSVREVMDEISSVIGVDLEVEVVGRRPGDPPATFASTDRIERELGWHATHGLNEMVASAWSAWGAHPTPVPGS
jgi:UDP-glucose 4-epimerase